MDPIGSITAKKDSSLAMLLEASRRDAEIHYFEQQDLRMLSGKAIGRSTLLTVRDDNDDWFDFGDQRDIELGDLDVILMRKDPPFNMEYVYTTYILDRAELAGALIVNAPQALRDMNEKAYTAWFPDCTPLTLVTRSMEQMKAFLAEHGRIVTNASCLSTVNRYRTRSRVFPPEMTIAAISSRARQRRDRSCQMLTNGSAPKSDLSCASEGYCSPELMSSATT